MASTTDNFNLDLYDTGDPAALTDQYNSAMHTIDDTLLTINDNADTALQNSTEIKGWLNNLGITDDGTATNLKNTIDKHTTDIAANTNAITTNTNNISELTDELDDVSNLAHTNQTSIAAINANLNALGANNVENASQLKKQINTNTQKITKYHKYDTGIMVTFGDSYADATNETYTWPYWLQQYIPTLTLKNYAVSGAGFNVDTRTFINQITTAENDHTLDKTNVKLAVLAGGRNDILSYNNASNKMKECVNKMISIFPNATILIVPMLYDAGYIDTGGREKLAGLTNGAETITRNIPRANTLKFAYLWLKGINEAIQSDKKHPNQLGAQIIAKYMYNGAYDNYTPRQEVYKTVFGDATAYIVLQNGTVTYDAMGSVSNIGEGKGAAMPAWASTWHNVWVWGVSGGSTTTPTLYQFYGTAVEMMTNKQTGNMAVHATWTA